MALMGPSSPPAGASPLALALERLTGEIDPLAALRRIADAQRAAATDTSMKKEPTE